MPRLENTMQQKTELLIIDINTIITGYGYEENEIVPIIDRNLNARIKNMEDKFEIIILTENDEQPHILMQNGIDSNNIKFITANRNIAEFLADIHYNYSFYSGMEKSNIYYIASNQAFFDQAEKANFKAYLVTPEKTLDAYLDILQYDRNTNPFVQSILNNTNSSAQQQNMPDQNPQESEDVPPEFICPITMGIMNDPVILTSGIAYDRETIEMWLKKNNTCPMTQQQNVSIIGPDLELKKAITEFELKHKTTNILQTQSVIDHNSTAKQFDKQFPQVIKTPQEDLEQLENEYVTAKNKTYADVGIFGRSAIQEAEIKALKNNYLIILEEALKNSFEVNDGENLTLFYIMANNSPLMKHNAGVIYDTLGINPDSADKAQELGEKYPAHPQKNFNTKS